jgi:glycosyltransferase involved in cell wall biosynthesis
MKRKIKANLRDTTAYSVILGIRRGLKEVRKEIEQRIAPDKKVVLLNPEGPSRGRVLFSYIIDGFFLEPGAPVPKTHTNIWQSIKMAETFVELGYEVEVIHFTNHSFIPKGNYSFFVDVRHNMQRLSPLLNKDCVRIMHLDTANILFHNAAGAKRLLELQERRGITLQPQRFEMPNLGIEHADYATTTGNDFTVNTFKYANKKIFKLPSPCGIMLDWSEKDWDQCRQHFLWFSSSGFVHKGLDLALESFREIPDCHLTVCAQLDKDQDFVRAYHKELYETRNINTVGWVDIDSSKFRDITTTCGSIVHLSCSEGGAPSVKMCMHAGLIPIVSYESGVDVDDFGFTLRDCSIDNIKNIIKHVATLSQSELQKRALLARKTARRYYTRENFAEEYRKAILEIIRETKSIDS